MKIKQYLYIFIMVFSLAPILIFGLIMQKMNTDNIKNLMVESLGIAVHTHVSEIDAFCQEQERDINILAYNSPVESLFLGNSFDDADVNLVEGMLRSRVAVDENLESITMVDKNYNILACTAKYANSYVAELSNIEDKIKNGDIFFSNVSKSSELGDEKDVIVVVKGVQYEGEIAGYFIKEFNLNFYNFIRDNSRLWDEGTFYLVDGNGQIIAAGSNEGVRNKYISTAEERRDYTEKYNTIDTTINPEGTIVYKFAGEDYITYYSTINHTNWRIMLSINIDAYTKELDSIWILFAVSALICIACALWINYFLSKRIMKPISNIIDVLDKIQQEQDYSHRISVNKQDEMGLLVDNINKLINYIEKENIYEKQRQRELKRKSERDALTKVMNKEKIMHELDKDLADGTVLAVLFIDIDDFKSFNNSYGHAVGDQVLLFVAATLSKYLNGKIGRVGGDEFLAIVTDTDVADNLRSYLSEITESLRTNFIERKTGRNLPISCCIGAAMTEGKQLTPDMAAELADQAMYHVKHNGKRGFNIV